METKTVTTNSPEETMQLAAQLAKSLLPGDMVALLGELGAGKTMFVKGLATGLGVKDPYVNSPSFVILKEYGGDKPLYHFDVYRLDEKEFGETIDYKRYFYGDGIAVVEWANKIQDLLPEEYLEIEVTYGKGDERNFAIRPIGDRFKTVLDTLKG